MSNILKKINRKKIKQDNKKDAIQLKNLFSKNQNQDEQLYSLIGATDYEIDKYFDQFFDDSIYYEIHKIEAKQKNYQNKKITKKDNEQILKDFEEHQYNMVSSGDYFYDNKRYILTFEFFPNGFKKYFFNIFDTPEPYFRRTKQLRVFFKPNNNHNKIVFDILKQKNLYYLKKPFEELLKYIHLMSLKIIMTVIFSNDRLYIRSCIEFYLQKYQIYFKRYVDNSSNRVKKHRLKIKPNC